MIRVRYQPAVGPVVEVEIPDGRELAVLERAIDRIFPGPPSAEDYRIQAERDARYNEVIRRRAQNHDRYKGAKHE